MTLTVQFNTMISMVIMGIVLGMSLDTYSRLIPAQNHWYWIRFINDTLFWIIQGLLVFWALLEVNQGEIRFYIFLALLCGFAAYKSLLESYYKKLLEYFITMIIRCYYMVKKTTEVLVIRPIRALLKLLLYSVKIILGIILTIIVYISRIILYPFKWLGLVIWSKIPVKIITKFKFLAGLFKKMKNTVKKWFWN
jgi:spore cortex biosynthesis protein YabQ